MNPPPPNPPAPRVVIPNTNRRDALIAMIVGVVLLAFVGYGVMTMSKPHASTNILVGTVTEKQFTPRHEEQVSFSGRRLQGAKQIDGEYVLKVRVDSEQRTYDVPVEKPVYEMKKAGDRLEFVRPPSEQK